MISLYESFNDVFQELPVRLYRHDLAGKLIWSPLHWHRSIELLITLEGHICVNVGSDNFDFSEDDWIIVNSCELHSSRYHSTSDHFKGISILLFLPFIETWVGKGVFFYNPHDAEITKSIQEIAASIYECEESMPYWSLFLLNQSCRLLLLLSEHCIRPNVKYSIPSYKKQAKASSFLEYIDLNYQENLTLNDISRHFQYSPGYFSRFFKETVGVNYYAYLNFVRVHHAARQLLEQHSSLTECALQNGFPNIKSFITVFKKIYGCTPKKFLNI